MQKKGLSISAGILSIVTGVAGLGLVAQSVVIARTALGIVDETFIVSFLFGASALSAVYFFPFSVLSLIGGIFCLRRRKWGLALAGSISAILVLFPLGIPAVVLTALSKKQFQRNP